MKRIVLLISCIVMCCSMIACGKVNYCPAKLKASSQYFPDMRDRGFFSQVDKWNLYLDKRVVSKERKGIAFALGMLENVSENYVDKITQGVEKTYYRFFSRREVDHGSIQPLFCLEEDGVIKDLSRVKKLGKHPFPSIYATIPFAVYYDDGHKPIYEFYISTQLSPPK